MDIKESYNKVLSLWLDEVDITNITFHSNGGATIPELIKTHDIVEKQCINMGKEALAMDWSIFQYFHKKSQKLNKEGIFILSTINANFKSIETLYNENIN